MDNELECDFFFGNRLTSGLEKFDIKTLKNAKELKSIWVLNKFYWISGTVPLILRNYNVFLITGQSNCLSDWVAILLARIIGRKVYIWNHGWYGKESKFRFFLDRVRYSLTTGFFLYGNRAKNLMIKNRIVENKLAVIYNSLDYDQILTNRKQLARSDIYFSRFGNNSAVLLFIGRLQPVKQLDMLVYAVKRMIERGRGINLVIVGEGPERNKLEFEVDKFNLKKNVWFLGPCFDEHLTGNIIYNADLCVSPGNVGLTCIHSLSYGTPVITHNNFEFQMPEFEAITPGITGVFFDHNNVESLTTEIENWLDKHPVKDEKTIQECFKIIDEKYNPYYQIGVLKSVLSRV